MKVLSYTSVCDTCANWLNGSLIIPLWKCRIHNMWNLMEQKVSSVCYKYNFTQPRPMYLVDMPMLNSNSPMPTNRTILLYSHFQLNHHSGTISKILFSRFVADSVHFPLASGTCGVNSWFCPFQDGCHRHYEMANCHTGLTWSDVQVKGSWPYRHSPHCTITYMTFWELPFHAANKICGDFHTAIEFSL